MLDTPRVLLVSGVLILLSILSSKFSERFGVPALLLFLGVGMLAGSDGIGGIYFDSALTANAVGTIALAFILFSGGLDTNWPSIRPVLGRGLVLSTVGVLVTALLLGLFVWLALDRFSFTESLLLAAIVSSTDAAAVFAVLRSRRVSLKGHLRPLLELESGSNDPMAIFLTTSLIALLTLPEASWYTMFPRFVLQMALGTFIGLGMGQFAAWLFNRVRLDYEGLYLVLSMSVVVIVFGLAEQIGGNGFLAVYLSGIVLGNHDFIYKRSLIRFHDGLSWLMQIGLFLVLGLLVFPSRLPQVIGMGLLVSGFLMFVARPIAIFLGLWRSALSIRERSLVAWTGLRGAVPIVLATFPYLAGYDKSELIFNIVFFVVITSVLLQGTTLMKIAGWLGVDKPLQQRTRYPLEFEPTQSMRGETREFEIHPDADVVGKQVKELGLPSDVLILMIHRDGGFLVPRGQTRIMPHDSLLVLAEPTLLQDARTLLEAKKPPLATSPSP